ncbi:hypothetical protein BOW51_12450 [Solemya velesiana gill symbiont]|uniref:Uncharacterized protein n=1 Tax=Solemya velesiana gill symbiont TaxID=1918948 RepID=A0A1T2KMB7_9GAMM|nr:hypothetical protein BOW51_12450 [Solemya velesiana gill symbiont]
MQLSAEVFYGFDLFLKQAKAPKGAATRLKSALQAVAVDLQLKLTQVLHLILTRLDSRIMA